MAKLKTSSLLTGASGKLGGLVLVQNGDETILRERPRVVNPDTSAQQSVRGNLTHTSRLYRTLTPEQLTAWQDYAERVHKVNPDAKKQTGYNLFSALTIKFLQMHPNQQPPLVPPAAAFFGDGLVVTAAPQVGGIRFVANRANAPDIVTELLVQKLASPVRTPQLSYYRSQAFVDFGAGTLAFQLTLEPGSYAPAYRFVNSTTGQQAGIAPLPAITMI